MKKWEIGIWCGCGYSLDTFELEASCEEELLEVAMAYCQKNGYKGLYITLEDYDKYLEGLTDEEREWEEEDSGLIYIDPTMTDADAFPAYFRTENLRIIELHNRA